MRSDAIGLFWEDIPVKKEKKEKVKRTPPEPVWLEPDYLPGYNEAANTVYDLYTDTDLIRYALQEPLVFDMEIYSNYSLAAFMGLLSRKIILFENDSWDLGKLRWLLETYTIITFNGVHYDIPIVTLLLKGLGTEELKAASDLIIYENYSPRDLMREYCTRLIKINHIDLFELGFLRCSLKLIAGRLHAKKMQDLPFVPEAILSPEQKIITRHYCINDLENTILMHDDRKEQIELRNKISTQYGIDVRSKSDAQIAEAVLGKTLRKALGRDIYPPIYEPGTSFRYNVPEYMVFKTKLLSEVLEIVRNTKFVVSEYGNIGLPVVLKNLKIAIGSNEYQMGIGGLHSTEKNIFYRESDTHEIVDLDVASYYPRIILNQGLYPEHIGPVFLSEYRTIVDRRLYAKQQGMTAEADTLKITVNGSFGKFGSIHSILYSPQLVIQITISGQLTLLLLIEALELAGFRVISANTDGVTVYYHKHRRGEFHRLLEKWERQTDFVMEQNPYLIFAGRDVNNYFAVKKNNTVKRNGIFKKTTLQKSPAGTIIYEAVVNYIHKGQDIAKTICECKDIRQFIFVRQVKGGAVKDGEYLGKVIRWYHSSNVEGEIVYAKTGNKVPGSENSRPIMQLPESFPDDIDYGRYIEAANKLLALWLNPAESD